MRRWYASVNYGFEKIAADMLRGLGAQEISATDSAVIFWCASELTCGCVNNLYEIWDVFRAPDLTRAVHTVLRGRIPARLRPGTFRVLFMDAGKLRAVPSALLGKLEAKITRATGQKPNRAKPDTEIWLSRRHDGTTFWMARVQKHTPFDKTLRKGELRPDVVQGMLHAARLNGQETVLDPFGGSGAIAFALAKDKRCASVLTADNDPACVEAMRLRLRAWPRCRVYAWDALAIPLPDESVDAIITDPPWGQFRQTEDALLPMLIGQAFRLLKNGGRLVMLCGGQQAASAEASFDKLGSFAYEKTNCKINGKNACLFIARKEGQA